MDNLQPGPIFIGGLERSGTSLLYALLASHPNIAMTRRTNLWPFFYQQYGNLANPENSGSAADRLENLPASVGPAPGSRSHTGRIL